MLEITPEGYRPVVVLMTDGYSYDHDVSAACGAAAKLQTSGRHMLFMGIGLGQGMAHLNKIVRSGNGGMDWMPQSDGAPPIPLCVECTQVSDLSGIFQNASDSLAQVQADYEKKSKM